MKFVRVLSGAGVATTLAAFALVGGAGGAHAAESFNGEGWVGQYWCAPDWRLRQKIAPGTVKILVFGSDFNGRGQTMQFKIIDPRTNRAFGWSGWFEIPTSVYKPIAYNVPHGTWFRLCATFGGGRRDVLHKWRGSLIY